MPLPTLEDLKDKGIKKPRVQDGKLETTRARPTKEKIDTDIDERDFENLTNLKEQEIKNKINSKFLESRNERINILNKDKAKEIENLKKKRKNRMKRISLFLK